MVRWQKELYSTKTQLQKLPAAQRVVKESRNSRQLWKAQGGGACVPRVDGEPHAELSPGRKVLETLNVNVEPEVRRINENLGSTSHLEKAHHDYLVKLQGL